MSTIMKKTIYEQLGGTYSEFNGYLIPNIVLPAGEEKPVGIWGRRHLRYIRQHRPLLYSNLLIGGKLNSYLVDIDQQAEEMFSRLIKQMAGRENVSEKLKAENQMLWVGKMNAIRAAATEIVNNDLILA